MKKILSFIIINLGLAAVLSLSAQNVEFTDVKFQSNPKGLKAALKAIQTGDKLAKNKNANYYLVLEEYSKANLFNGQNAALNAKIADCYYILHNNIMAAQYGTNAHSLDPNSTYRTIFYNGLDLQLKCEYDEAITVYQTFLRHPSATDAEKTDVNNRIRQCETGKKLVKYELNCFVDNAGEKVNTSFAEYTPILFADKSFTFVGRKEQTKAVYADNIKYGECIYKADLHGDVYTANVAPVEVTGACAMEAVTKDGKRAIYYSVEQGGDLMEGVKKSPTKKIIAKPIKKINTPYHESSAAYSISGDTLYFCSDRKGGYGGHDIYFTVRNKHGKYSKPVNLGSTINTAEDELSVFIDPLGTLYFASRGHDGMGGYDIFYSKQENKQWTVPQNIGYPINTPYDDLYFYLSGDGKKALIASNRAGGYGDQDIYFVTLLGERKSFKLYEKTELLAQKLPPLYNPRQIEIEQEKKTIVKGIVIDAKTKQPLAAAFELSDLEANALLANFNSDSTTGSYTLDLPSGYNYGLAVKAPGYLFHSQNFELPDTAVSVTIEQVIELKKIEVNQVIVLRNIFFDVGKATLKKESETEIENAYKLLNENPDLKIEISGHTDNTGSASLNRKLSMARANSVITALVAKGIDKSRFKAAGYGPDKPIATNKTTEGKALNRRIEFKVIK